MIDENIKIHMLVYDDEYEETKAEKMTIKEALDRFTEEGCPVDYVIRCKDCEHCFDNGKLKYCVRRSLVFKTSGNDFCSYGERKK